jgi:nucleotide-binding universal stress UspA family protein
VVKQILVAIDGSEPSYRALDLASDIATKYGAQLTLLHVIPPGSPPEALKHFAAVEHIKESPEVLRDQLIGERLMGGAKHRAQVKGVTDIVVKVNIGDPAQVILKQAESFNLLVMGRRGLGPLQNLLQGSVSQKVTQLTEVTCVTVT